MMHLDEATRNFIDQVIKDTKKTTYRRFDVVSYFKYSEYSQWANDWLDWPCTENCSPNDDRVTLYDIRIWLESKGLHVYVVDQIIRNMNMKIKSKVIES